MITAQQSHFQKLSLTSGGWYIYCMRWSMRNFLKGHKLNTGTILNELHAERDKIDRAISALLALKGIGGRASSGAGSHLSSSSPLVPRKRRQMSKEARRKI